jgi:putative protease
LKAFSARMGAQNFTIDELARLSLLARSKGVQVFVAFNVMIKPDEISPAGHIIARLQRQAAPEGLIVQDLALVEVARRAGFTGKVMLSTLANVSFGKSLGLLKDKVGVTGVVLPRELSVDEIKAVAKKCPKGLDLEVFVHGALCYAVSGRCYWSSYLGGKSGLRGRCVQPCRRMYRAGKETRRYFSCSDLSIDVLVKVLKDIPRVRMWKIEGRKKGPHYVYYTVSAYRMLRDQGRDPKLRRAAGQLLEMALGREGTHYNFLSQRPQTPLKADGRTGSGFFLGTLKGSGKGSYLVPRLGLLAGDTLRIGFEDAPGHRVQRLGRHVPAGGRMHLKPPRMKKSPKGLPVFLIDRREQALQDQLNDLEEELKGITVSAMPTKVKPIEFSTRHKTIEKAVAAYTVYRRLKGPAGKGAVGVWLSAETVKTSGIARKRRCWWWLPPVIWPDEEDRWQKWVDQLTGRRQRHFVLNAPWQTSLFKAPADCTLWAGPFCNVANGAAAAALERLGFKGVLVSPELDQKALLQLPDQSPLPVGLVIHGNWPLCVSRIYPEGVKTVSSFHSPRGETAWSRRYGQNTWLYPNWQLDLRQHQKTLLKAGYTQFVHLVEPVPRAVKIKQRPGLWNWKLNLT